MAITVNYDVNIGTHVNANGHIEIERLSHEFGFMTNDRDQLQVNYTQACGWASQWQAMHAQVTRERDVATEQVDSWVTWWGNYDAPQF